MTLPNSLNDVNLDEIDKELPWLTEKSKSSQEDPDTQKRIQQILDEYKELIRNPDLQNRPAPRRRRK